MILSNLAAHSLRLAGTNGPCDRKSFTSDESKGSIWQLKKYKEAIGGEETSFVSVN
jgi:hypothetical protein